MCVCVVCVFIHILQYSVDPVSLNSVLRSPSWTVYATVEGKLYYVNNSSKG